ncbi:hypothetical protein CYR55_21405 [Chimaeribacter californicus]|uniref:DnaJ homologue subfamily C member 28 conserved domain-containing protein n=1 Tax=Chimaeribacter californicus TaxID=2060067 RepID=A0A2N5DV99_9GAMM|nr:DUF1992 domain-containing protein [Chimaeribacter californicus]PLR30959.1 hypothetical protein CYR55_21405 [Chimaeribacter californicus]
MWLIDEMVERHIREAEEKGEFENLPGSGKPLALEDDSGVPAELRTAYRLLKNSGYLPPELQDRNEALQLSELMHAIEKDNPDYVAMNQRLKVLGLRLQQAGMSTEFLKGHYKQQINNKIAEKLSNKK